MTKEQKDKILKLMAKERNDYARECNRRIEKENGKITGADYMLQRFLNVIVPEVEKSEDKRDNGNELTYGDIYNEFCKKFPNVEVEDYRPAITVFEPQVSDAIPYAIVIWLKDGSRVIYASEREDMKDEKIHNLV